MNTISTANKAPVKSSIRVLAPPKYWSRRLALSSVIAVGILVTLAGTSYAYLALQTNAAANPFAATDVRIALVENNELIVAPSQELSLGEDTKMVEVANLAGASDAVVRVTFSPQLVSDESTTEQTLYEFFNGGSISAPVDNKVVMGSVTLHFAPGWDNESNGWFFKDGFFYYNHILEADNKTPPLLAGVTTTLTNAQLEVLVSAEGLQAYPDEATAVWGVSIS